MDSANKRTWFWPVQSSTGLMSGRKQGFPSSLQEKRTEFDDTSECSKVFFVLQQCKLGVRVIFSPGFPLDFTSFTLDLWRSFTLDFRS